MGLGRSVGEVRGLEALLGEAGGRNRHVEDLGDRGGDGALVGDLVAIDDCIGTEAGLFVGRTGERDGARDTGDRALDEDGIPHRPDMGVVGLEELIDDDRPVLCKGYAALLEEGGIGPDPDGEDDQVRFDEGPTGKVHGDGGPMVLERLYRILEVEVHPLGPHVLLHLGGQFIVDDVHHLLERLDDRDLQAPLLEVLGHLQADEASADDHGAAGGAPVDVALDRIDVTD